MDPSKNEHECELDVVIEKYKEAVEKLVSRNKYPEPLAVIGTRVDPETDKASEG